MDEILNKINFLKLEAQNEFLSDLKFIERNSREELNFLSNKKVLFTGGGGFIGYYFYYTITYWNKVNKKKNINYTILDNIKKKPDWLNTSKVNFIRRDINNLKKNFFTKFDIIIHGASIASPTYYREEPIKTMKANILGLWKILESLKNKNKNKILFFFLVVRYMAILIKNIFLQKKIIMAMYRQLALEHVTMSQKDLVRL